MAETMQEKMEREIRESMEKLYPPHPDNIYKRMQVEFYACNYEKKSLTLRFPVLEWEVNHMMTMHGGLMATAIDTTCGAVVRSVSGCIQIPTINLNINYLAPGIAGDALLVTAQADRVGHRICSVHAVCRSQKTGKILSTATANFMSIE